MATLGSPQRRYITPEAQPELPARQVFLRRLEPMWPELWALTSLNPRQLAMPLVQRASPLEVVVWAQRLRPEQPASAEVAIAPALLLIAVWELQASQLLA